MSAVLERQRWLAVLALAAAVPLPLTGVVSWPFLVPYVVVAAWVAASRRPLPPLPAWAENLLAPAILAAVVAAGGVRYGVLRPVAQLAVLVAAVRLPGCGQARRARLTGGVVTLVGIAGIASSTHPALAAYLVALLALVVAAAGRLTGVALARGDSGRPPVVGWPPARLVVASVVTAVLVAAPLFALLPRLRSPFAGSPFGAQPASGFRALVGLRGIGDITLSRRTVMRVSFPGVAPGHVSPDWLRLAGATLRHYRAGGWVEAKRKGERLGARGGRPIALAGEPAAARLVRAEIVLERGGGSLFLPLGATEIAVRPGVAVVRDPLGSLRVPRGTEFPLDYSLEFDPARVVQPAPDEGDLELPPESGPLVDLATAATRGTTNRLAAALAIEQDLQTHYRYSLRSNAPVREDPVLWFLFSSREGHCEFFASSMVLLLRSVGIPARLQAGYIGGESEGNGSYLVRESNAHAWVLGFVDNRWRVFDPTPPEGRPGVLAAGGTLSLSEMWDRFERAWDRWVLTFSLSDQLDIASAVAGAVAGVARDAAAAVAAVAGSAAVIGLAWWLRRRRRDAPRRPGADRKAPFVTVALRRVMAAAGRRGIAVTPGATPRVFAAAVAAAVPAAAGPLDWLAREHERTRYAGAAAPPARAVRRAARAVERALKTA
ncbi:MAG: transglutaminaseTgpA domain-containing protein [Thermoanaerobaculaceae bacterium]|nr:transglutaminaseTgpA domain-containing protein [Thermoanaerobaculaceae bacterium]